MKRKSFIKIFLSFFVALFLCISCSKKTDITILYTNDVHACLEKDISYAKIAALKKKYISEKKPVFLVDAGDHVQGTAYGSMDKGGTIIQLMNAAGYDVSAVGNHEFDYGFERFEENRAVANFDYLASNFFKVEDESLFLKGYKVFDCSGVKIAFVGVMTPGTINKAGALNFMDGAKEKFLYKIASGENGEELYSAVQKSVDEAKKSADYVIVLSHLGISKSSVPYTSRDLIASTTGIDAVIDGHSHTVIENETVANKNGKPVCLTQTGSGFAFLGQMTIMPNGIIKTQLLDSAKIDGILGAGVFDNAVQDIQNQWFSQVEEDLNHVVANCKFNFCAYDVDGKRLVRNTETNLGDFIADSIYFYINKIAGLNCDIAFMNGGGIRCDIESGNLTYLMCMNVQPFGNMLCLVKMTGEQILRMLEFSVGNIAINSDFAGFLQASGLKFEVDVSDVGSNIKNVMVYNKEQSMYEPLDLNKHYAVGGLDYFLLNGGDGYIVSSEVVANNIVEDFLATAVYAENFKKNTGAIPEISTQNSPLFSYKNYLLNYENVYGAARIIINKF